MADDADTPTDSNYNSASGLLQRAVATVALRAVRDIGSDVRIGELTDDDILHLVRGVVSALSEPIEEAAVFISSSKDGREHAALRQHLADRLRQLLE